MTVLDHQRLQDEAEESATTEPRPSTGRIIEVAEQWFVVAGLEAQIGEVLEVGAAPGRHIAGRSRSALFAEVVATRGEHLICLPVGTMTGIDEGRTVTSTGSSLHIEVGFELVGHLLDGFGRPMDDHTPLAADRLVRIAADPASRGYRHHRRIHTQLGVGVRTIDTLTPIGCGERVSLSVSEGDDAGALGAMVARGTTADVSVIALIGRTHSQVRSFLDALGADGLSRSIVVIASDEAPAVERMRAGFIATRIAEWFSDHERNALLIIDSLTAVARAQRDVYAQIDAHQQLKRGYPLSVFSTLPSLVQRTGTVEGGALTGIYVVESSEADETDPITDIARAVTDGHIVVSATPSASQDRLTVDIAASQSRLAPFVVTAEQMELADRVRELLGAHAELRELMAIGAYVSGADAAADAVFEKAEAIELFLAQQANDPQDLASSWGQLAALVA